ncbi:DEAD/DEAH box helicase [Bacillus sp. DNRA2]|uniref:DEAD/DEAH box helicase n=1 Tax=Bacillus sp. DNRA2 TaxID=2723053 RepID=UPI00145DBEF7|nr:DEAD/DEAH box helicase [Bacillus sp. DNRA2]NMD69744.1 DEAD/DEAH box helicase [Bacillus sp. DNRA2]
MQKIMNIELKPFLQTAWEKAGFEQLTTVQMKTIPFILEGRDVIAESPTGTGKTLSYLLPVLQKIDVERRGVQAVILASSQELCMQILGEIQKWGEGSGIRSASFIGGANLKRQLEKLKKAPQVVVGTPGRVLELIKQKKLKMHEVKTVVLDEGDQLLIPEHLTTVRYIVNSPLADRQVLVFSATLPAVTEDLARGLTNNPELVKITRDETIKAEKVDHVYLVCEQREKLELLQKVARLSGIKALAFMNDIGAATVAVSKMNFKGISAGVLHSELKKLDRQSALKQFRDGESSMLIATDVAARGLDIKGITHVVHVDFPKEINQYVHRSGRTGRFGASGMVIALVTEREERELKKFYRELGLSGQKRVFFKGELVSEK